MQSPVDLELIDPSENLVHSIVAVSRSDDESTLLDYNVAGYLHMYVSHSPHLSCPSDQDPTASRWTQTDGGSLCWLLRLLSYPVATFLSVTSNGSTPELWRPKYTPFRHFTVVRYHALGSSDFVVRVACSCSTRGFDAVLCVGKLPSFVVRGPSGCGAFGVVCEQSGSRRSNCGVSFG